MVGEAGQSYLWGNRWRLHLAVTNIYGPTGAVVGNITVVGTDWSLRFNETVGVGGGAVRYNRNGMTSVTDAGAAGARVIYNPTTDNLGIHDATGVAYGHYVSDAAYTYYGTNMIFTGALGVRQYVLNVLMNDQIATGAIQTGWLLAKSVCIDDASEFINDDFAALAAPGVKWLSAIAAGGSIADVVGARGGVKRLTTILTTPTTMQGCKTAYSAQDAYRAYFRYAMQQVADIEASVGFCDVLPAAGAGSNPFTNEAIICTQDDAVGANFLLRQVTGGAVVDDDTTIAVVAGEFVQIDLIVATTRVPTLYINGTLRATGAAADSPAAATMLRKVIHVQNIGAAVNAQLDIDCFFPVESRNTAVTP